MRRIRRSRLHAGLFLGLGLVLTGVALLLYGLDALRDPELDTVDARFQVRGDRSAPADVVVVEIDDVSFDELRRRWPFPRSLHARAVRRIAADGPKAIAYDVQFTEPSERVSEDVALAEAIADAKGKVVLTTTEVNERGETNVLGGDDVLRDIGARAANGNLPPDPGGVLRRVPYTVDKLESLAVATTEVATGRQVRSDSFGDGPDWIDYAGPPDTVRSVSFSRVVRGRTRPGLFRDKIVVIGASAPSLQDVHPTSTTRDDLMSGPEIQANAIDTVRRGLPLRSARPAIDVALIVLLGLVSPLVSLRLSAWRMGALAVAVALAYTLVTVLAFNGGTVLSFVYPVGALVITAFGSLVLHYVTTAFERERVRALFARFVPEDVVDEALACADDDLRIGGVQREGTVMFTDLRGFTGFAESLPPAQVIRVLNRYLSGMSEAIMAHGGTLVAYMGDGIMAVFGAPVPQPDHADRALAAVREMVGERLPRFNEWLSSEGLGDGFYMGAGLNSGPVMSGNVGSERRLEYTAIGDAVNTAARLEAMTKEMPYQVLLSDSTRSLLEHEPPELSYLGEFEVRGRQAKVKLWALTGERFMKKEAPHKEAALPASST